MIQKNMSEESILVVDDDEVFAETLANALTRRGYKALMANNIDAALTQAEEHQPQRAIIDLKIDQESGLTLLPALAEKVDGIQMLILTGYSSIATAVAAMQLGALNYVCKPADADEILAAFKQDENPGDTAPVPENPPSVKRLQWEHVQKVLKESDGNISATARTLGMHRRTLQRYLLKKPVKR